MSFVRAFLLAIPLFFVGLGTHEVAHLAVYSAQGVPATLLVTHWRLGLAGVDIWGLHAAPVGGAVPLDALVTNNGLAPALAALLLFVLWLAIDRRSRAARAAVLANVLVLVFFAAIELAYPLLEDVGHVDADVLLLPELNYGACLLIVLATTLARTRPVGGSRRSPATPGPRERERPSGGGQRRTPAEVSEAGRRAAPR